MTKEEYIKEKEILTRIIKETHERVSNLTNEYIKRNASFKVGDIVTITNTRDNSRNAIVNGFELDYNDNIKPTLFKIKKDGTPSMHKDYVWMSDKIEPVINS